ncbi:suppressor of tumorigenicity 14 protein homolog [Parasteatoda tepidariorum]|uniref:suppressor of tumorigenicity 14 protein homolog n=1 Tax=Parasteatoda tepidariorum TaxID=114398 RepID=UPI0039BC5211
MASFNYFFCILGILFCQVCLIYSSCEKIEDLSGAISHSYSILGDRLYHKCWTLENPDKNVIFIQLNNITLHNGCLQPASGGVLTIKFLPENEVFNLSSQSQLRNFTTTSSVVEIHFKVNAAQLADGMKTGFSLNFTHNCNRVLTEFNGSIYSPYYQQNRRILGAECIYIIRLRPGYLVNITYHDVKIGSHFYRDGCSEDYLEINDGNTEKSRPIRLICGSSESFSVQSTSNHLWMKLKASHFLNKGFYASYNAVEIEYEDCYPRDSFGCDRITCIPRSEVCDGIKNCEDGEDEFGCVINCEGNDSFRCSENTCIAKSEVCDGMINCQNGADEIDCHDDNSADDKLESTTMALELPPYANGATHSTIKDFMDMEVKEHRRRLEVIELQKKYEMARIEFQKQIEIERLKQRNNTITLKFEELQEDAIRIVFGNRSAKAVVIHN